MEVVTSFAHGWCLWLCGTGQLLVTIHLSTGNLLPLQALLTLGLQRETVTRGSTGVYFQMLFAVVLERMVFGVVPSLLSVLGAAIIVSSALCVIVSDCSLLLHDSFTHLTIS
jgi:drug/metabolite transporter (DMT)-like permease